MPRGPFAPFLHYVRSRRRAADADAELLARFAADRDDDAFAELVRRHGPLVWGVVRQVLGHDQDAEDAFQATFVLLAHKAGSIRSAAAVAGWLHGTAWRVATKARTRGNVRRERERSVPPRPNGDPTADVALRELQALLHAEVAALPAKYRTPFVLCVLEGRGRTEVARSLGWNEGTLSTRLAWARRRLRSRLLRRGVDVGAALAAVEVTRGAVPAALASSAVTAARTGIVSATVAALAHGGFMTTKLAPLMALGLVLGVIAAGSAGLMGSDPPAAGEAPKAKGAARADAPPPPPAPKTPTGIVTVTGTATGPDGKPVKGAVIRLAAGRGSWLAMPEGGIYHWSVPEAALKIVSSATTDERGRYRFEDTAVPIYEVENVAKFCNLVVAGTAPNEAVTWSDAQTFRFSRDDNHRNLTGPAVVDLSFGERTLVQGRIEDERKRPVAGAQVRVTSANSTVPPQDSKPRMNGPDCIPVVDAVTTDGIGRFQFVGLPRNLIIRVEVEYPDRTVISFAAVTPLDGPIPEVFQRYWSLPVGELDMNGTKHRLLELRVVSATTGNPVAGVSVSTAIPGPFMKHTDANAADPASKPETAPLRFLSSATSDKEGRALLRVPLGQRIIDLSPPAEMGYAVEQLTTNVSAQPKDQSITVRLLPCCRLEIEAVDVDTGRPIVSAYFCRTGKRELPKREVATGGNSSIRLAETDFPLQGDNGVAVLPFTDDAGKIAVSVKPGPTSLKVFGTVQKVLPGDKEVEITEYDLVKGPQMPLDLKPGGEMTVRFELRKKGPPRREPYKPVSY